MKVKDKVLNPIEFSDTVIVSDPCYDRGTWCTAKLLNVLPGQWIPHIKYYDAKDWGIRVRQLLVTHSTYKPSGIDEWIPDEIGVDSGQCGIYCNTIYPNGEKRENDNWDEEWYNPICELTSTGRDEVVKWHQDGEQGEKPIPTLAGVLNNGKGVVSSSGYGDGGYSCAIKRNSKGQIVGIKIVFI